MLLVRKRVVLESRQTNLGHVLGAQTPASCSGRFDTHSGQARSHSPGAQGAHFGHALGASRRILSAEAPPTQGSFDMH